MLPQSEVQSADSRERDNVGRIALKFLSVSAQSDACTFWSHFIA